MSSVSAQTQDVRLSQMSGPTDADTHLASSRVINHDAAESEANESNTGIRPPGGTFPDSRPSKRYQIILAISGFLMIFQVMGLNSIYGVFQVRRNDTTPADLNRN